MYIIYQGILVLILLGHDVYYLPGDIHCSSSLIVHFFRDLQSSLCHSIENEKLLASYLQIKEEEDQYNHVVVYIFSYSIDLY
jgi:hypothetical protein